MKTGVVLGLMSGTSLDGLDLCLVKFRNENNDYSFQILKCESVNYPHLWQDKLRGAIDLKSEDLALLNIELGIYYGKLVLAFLEGCKETPDYIASHGHTVFHQPDNGLTLQIGDGNNIFSETGIPVIYDFRSLDVALKGQGAPLVPIGDHYLFSEYLACINFGGIANISFQKNNIRLAHDICPVNMILSDITSEINLPYDDKGQMARQGQINTELLHQLNALPFYNEKGPKSIGVEWYASHVKPLIKNNIISIEDRLRTVVEHITQQIANVLLDIGNGKVLITGGGVYNSFLIEILSSKVKQKIVIPGVELIEFKEALIFAFLGWLRINNRINVLKSVTGAVRDSCSGIVIE